jgi:hypothetical protein
LPSTKDPKIRCDKGFGGRIPHVSSDSTMINMSAHTPSSKVMIASIFHRLTYSSITFSTKFVSYHNAGLSCNSLPTSVSKPPMATRSLQGERHFLSRTIHRSGRSIPRTRHALPNSLFLISPSQTWLSGLENSKLGSARLENGSLARVTPRARVSVHSSEGLCVTGWHYTRDLCQIQVTCVKSHTNPTYSCILVVVCV